MTAVIISLVFGILTLHLIEVFQYRRYFSSIFQEISTQKNEGKTHIRIERKPYTLAKSFGLRWVDDFFIAEWILTSMANYYNVESIEFIEPK